MSVREILASDLNLNQLEDALWRGARGLYHHEAAVLLIGFHDYWLRNGHFRKAIILDSDSPEEIDGRFAWIDWDLVFSPKGEPLAAATGGSSSAHTVLRFAAALNSGLHLDLHGLAGLDDSNLRLVLAAMSHAARGFDRPGPVSWPERP